jgi:hypothetical protein
LYVNHIEFENLETVVIAAPQECDQGVARNVPGYIERMLRQKGLPYTLGKGSARPSSPPPDTRAASTLAELVSIASNGQEELEDCVFIYDFNSAASTSTEQEQAFRSKLDNTKRYGVPLLYSFVFGRKLHLVLYQQCRSGLKVVNFVQAILGASAAKRLSRPRPASPREVQRLLKEFGGSFK